MHGKTALITGGSSGIGLALAERFAADGHRLFIVALGADALAQAKQQLEAAYGVEVITLEKDLAERGAPQDVYDFAAAHDLTIDVLVNNAGFGHYGRFEDSDPAALYDLILVNCAALVALTRLFYPEMLARGSGSVLNMASTTGMQPTPNMAVYAASKAFVGTFSHALNHEARAAGGGVTVTAVYPYAVRTNFAAAAHMEGHAVFRNAITLEPAQVADAAYRAMQAGRLRVIVPRVGFFVFDLLYRLLTERAKMALVQWGMRP